MTDTQQLRFTEYYDELKKADVQALATELAAILVMVPLMPVQKTLERVRENSKRFRKNKRNQTYNNKLARLKVLVNKKRLSKAEQIEAGKLAADLKIDLTGEEA